ncbi:MAG: hypothetical protein ACOCWG_02585 [bacterium]
MEKRIIIGLVGDKNVGKTTMANRLVEEKDFYKIDISDKVKEFATHLVPQFESYQDKSEILTKIRLKGCKINKSYWINLCLSSVVQDHAKIVLDEIIEPEIIPSIEVYQIYRPKISTKTIPNVVTICNDKSLKSFISKIDDLNI